MSFIANPTVPFAMPLACVSPGLMIQVAGRLLSKEHRFTIDLQCGPKTCCPRDDVALHLTPHFDGDLSKIIRNAMLNHQWGMEESYGHSPYQDPNQSFTILIWCQEDRFKIAINNQHYADFPYRLPLERINTLIVDGKMELNSVRVEKYLDLQHTENYGDTGKDSDTTSNDQIDSADSNHATGVRIHIISPSDEHVPRPESDVLVANKSPVPSENDNATPTVDLDVVAVTGAATVTGYSNRLSYPGQGPCVSASPSKRHRHHHEAMSKEELMRRRHHRPTKASSKKWSSSSSSSSSSGSE